MSSLYFLSFGSRALRAANTVGLNEKWKSEETAVREEVFFFKVQVCC